MKFIITNEQLNDLFGKISELPYKFTPTINEIGKILQSLPQFKEETPKVEEEI